MEKNHEFSRPSFEQACGEWKQHLARAGFPTDLLWVFDENLCFESAPNGCKLSIQTRFTPPPEHAAEIAYEQFSQYEQPLVFYRAGDCAGKSVCLLLCDAWFRQKGPADGYLPKENWLMLFRPGTAATLEEVVEEPRWKARVLRDRPLHELDFCMPLRSVHEILAHGRVLSNYEHYALKFLHAWARLLGKP